MTDRLSFLFERNHHIMKGDGQRQNNEQMEFILLIYIFQPYMQYASALALSSLSGKAPTKDSIIAILKATGKPVDEKQVDAVLKSLNGRKVEDVISKGLTKVSVGASVGGSAPAGKKDEKKEEPKKKEEAKKKEEPKAKEPEPAPAEDDTDFNLDLFG